ncbi:hypothetical protein PACILC2_30050 [Paenibacillus cisolokensis]|uniref:Uncharacterized protein n=1 Tax=Paenibacillus cisolokensis TaxID=1658519 RepID=A0ABQ4N8B7_9BACL|nr:hypothetical protein PACILC2_30050 [Paenibacillus cisolokensis]
MGEPQSEKPLVKLNASREGGLPAMTPSQETCLNVDGHIPTEDRKVSDRA